MGRFIKVEPRVAGSATQPAGSPDSMLVAMQIGMLLFPKLTQLDLTGPHEVLARLPGATTHLVGKTRDPVTSETGLTILPTVSFAEAPALDLLFVPGGFGQIAATDDAATLAWIAAAGASAAWVTSACTGSLLLGAAGLLRGYRAATHWAFMELLPLVGAIPVAERVVVDRNRITGGGVTAGIDLALTIVAAVSGREVAEQIQLQLEYAPAPPFASGHPSVAAPALVTRARAQIAGRYAEREAQLRRITGSG
ncbi:MAG: ThiJ/PfpI domain protein [Deltaproteobacteria bacterium]|nr:ThiJ/PfpI domain protein [Deltaproteobacteria bacterium]